MYAIRSYYENYMIDRVVPEGGGALCYISENRYEPFACPLGSQKESNMKKSTIMLAAVLAGIGAQASVVVQWGENLVTNAVVASTVSFDNVPTTTYTDNQADAMAGTGYYALNTGARSPSYNFV